MVPTPASRKAASSSPLGWLVTQDYRQLAPPLAGHGGFLLIWQILSMTGLIALAGSASLFTEERTRERSSFTPFIDRGGLDKGLFWQTHASLSRVAPRATPWRPWWALLWASRSV